MFFVSIDPEEVSFGFTCISKCLVAVVLANLIRDLTMRTQIYLCSRRALVNINELKYTGGAVGVGSSGYGLPARRQSQMHQHRCDHLQIRHHHHHISQRKLMPSSSALSKSSRLYSQPTSTPSSQPTLFDLPNLSHPSDFTQLANEAIRSCDAIRKDLAHSLQQSTTDNDSSTTIDMVQKARQTLHQLDDISNIVCTIIDAAELCRSVHASPQWRRGALDAFGILSEYIGSLNADDRLYLSLRRFVFQDDDGGTENSTDGGGSDEGGGLILAQLPSEYQRFAHAMRKEFERDGIHLSYTKREEARELNNVIVGLETMFTSNITEKTKHYAVQGEEMVGEVEKIVPRHILGQLVRGAPPTDNNGNSITLSSDALLTNTLLAHSPSPQLRKEVYLQSNTSLPENLSVLDSLIRHRHMHSTLLGYKSHAHRVLSDRMVGSPEVVAEFLDRMGERSKDVYKSEMKMMLEAKRYVEGDASGGIEPWDVPFYTTFIKAQRQHQRWQEDEEWDGVEPDESSSGYFTVENSIEGMKMLVHELFGITMKESAIPIEERWDVDTTHQSYSGDGSGVVKGSGLRKFEFHHEEGPLGVMYFDLHPREGKFVHAAHFTIRCGRVRDDDGNGQGQNNAVNNHQLPIVALVCNLSPSSSPDASPSKAILSHSEVETLYHEFGHGLHSLLSRTAFQHLSGTRAAMDFVETPSHLFETFARDASFLTRVLARHYVTGVPMTERRAKHLALSHSDFRGVEVQTQIVHSKFDQALFGENPCSPALGGYSSTDMFERLHREAGLPYATGTHWQSRFGHLVTYGAGYYGYLYAQTFAADIWSTCLASSSTTPTSASTVREGGMKVWKGMLIHGGAKDPKEMLVSVLGRDPSVESFFKGMS